MKLANSSLALISSTADIARLTPPEGSLELGVEGRSFIYARGRGQGLFHMSQAGPDPLWVWSGELPS